MFCIMFYFSSLSSADISDQEEVGQLALLVVLLLLRPSPNPLPPCHTTSRTGRGGRGGVEQALTHHGTLCGEEEMVSYKQILSDDSF